MKLAKAIVACFGAAMLCGCVQTYQAEGPGTAGFRSASTNDLLYGAGASSSPRPVRPRRAAIAVNAEPARSALTADASVIYSEEWRQRELDREAKLKRATAICRC